MFNRGIDFIQSLEDSNDVTSLSPLRKRTKIDVSKSFMIWWPVAADHMGIWLSFAEPISDIEFKQIFCLPETIFC